MKNIIRALAVFLAGLLFFSSLPVSAEEGYWQGLTDQFVVYRSLESAFSGPACAKAVLFHLLGEEISQKQLAREAGTDEEGTYLFNLVKVLNGYQVYKRFAAFKGKEFDTFKGLLYETVVRGKTPVIVGVEGKRSEGWPHEDKEKYVMVYQMTADQAWSKIVDPDLLNADGDNEEAFFTLATEDLYKAYRHSADGLAYAVPGAGQLSDDVPQGKVSILLPDEIGPADVKKLNYDLINTTDGPIYYNEDFTLERNIAQGEWEEVELPGTHVVNVSYKLPGGKKKTFSTDILDRLNAGPNGYRLSKTVVLDGELTVIYSNRFVLNMR